MPMVPLENATQAASFYLNKINNKQNNELQNRYMLLAIHAYLNNGDYLNADNLLNAIKGHLVDNDEIHAEFIYLSALSKMIQKIPVDAANLLYYPQTWSIPSWQWKNYYQLKANIYQQLHQPINEIKQLSALTLYTPREQHQEINDKIWQLIQPLSTAVITPYLEEQDSPNFAGWMQLAYIVKHYAVSPNELIRYLGQWQQQNPNHPAAINLPTSLTKALNTKAFSPQHIAVLLPLSGARSNVANPIEQGILSSYLQHNNSQISIKFYDTESDVIQAYQQAVSDGAEFIIGPLLQKNVDKINQYQIEYGFHIPQLFLNKPSNLSNSENKFYFSLSPVEEASDAAKHFFNAGIHTPLLLASDDPIGRRMAASFNQEWLTLSNKDADIHYFKNGDKMKLAVQEALGVTDSEKRIARIKKIIGDNIKADFRSRRDIDAIYMIADAKSLTLLKPFIDVNFSVFTQPVPLYTASRGRLNRHNNTEVDGVSISDAPWLLSQSKERNQVDKLWPRWNYNQKRLFIMGADTYDLINKLAQMQAFPGYQFHGRAGKLALNKDGTINRHLEWAKYQQGKLTPLVLKN